MRPAACATAHRRQTSRESAPFRGVQRRPRGHFGRESPRRIMRLAEGWRMSRPKIGQTTGAPDAKTQRCRRHAAGEVPIGRRKGQPQGPRSQFPAPPTRFGAVHPYLYSANPCLFGIHQPWKGRMLEANPLGTGPLFFVRPSRVVFALFRTADKPDQRPAT